MYDDEGNTTIIPWHVYAPTETNLLNKFEADFIELVRHYQSIIGKAREYIKDNEAHDITRGCNTVEAYPLMKILNGVESSDNHSAVDMANEVVTQIMEGESK
jgi:hypothetical protein